MKIVADENIPFVKQAFSCLGEVTTVAGRTLSAGQLDGAELLLVRSVTPVNQELLHNSKVRFVATATIGTDHIDLDYLQHQGIGFASAPGSNAISAAEYVIAALLACFSLSDLRQKTVAVVGCGNVGSRVLKRLEVLGVPTIAYDPPRQESMGDRSYVSWQQVLQADVITAHVPFTSIGPYPTMSMFSETFFEKLKPNAVFVNTARGSVVDEDGLWRVLSKRDDLTLVLDVWRNEPTLDINLLPKVQIATPHIAGYSLDGKVRGTHMIFQSVCDYFGHPCEFEIDSLPLGDNPEHIYFKPGMSESDIVSQAVKHAYDITNDDQRLRNITQMESSERASYFDQLRKNYPVRREFSHFTAHVDLHRTRLVSLLQGLEFQVDLMNGTTIPNS